MMQDSQPVEFLQRENCRISRELGSQIGIFKTDLLADFAGLKCKLTIDARSDTAHSGGINSTHE